MDQNEEPNNDSERMKWLKENELFVAFMITAAGWVFAIAILIWSVDEVIDFFKE